VDKSLEICCCCGCCDSNICVSLFVWLVWLFVDCWGSREERTMLAYTGTLDGEIGVLGGR